MTEIVKVDLENEMDLILAHKRTMKLAELTGHSLSAQTIFATAVSEIARCAIEGGESAYLSLGIETLKGQRKQMKAIIKDLNPFCTEGSISLQYAKRLVEDVHLKVDANGCEVTINQKINFPGTITEARIDAFIEYFLKEPALSAYDELRRKNIQLQELAEKLLDSENDYRQLTDKLPLMMFATNMNGEVSYTNKWLQDFFGLPEGPMPEMVWRNFVHPDDYQILHADWEKARQNKIPFKMQGRLRQRTSNLYIWHLISIVPVKNEKNTITKWIGFFADINAQKLIEETLRDNIELKAAKQELQRSNQELASFSYVASHDLQEPLRKIQTFSQRILDIGEFNEKTSDYFARINAAARRMQNLIDSLLNFSKVNIEDGLFEATDLNDVLAEAIGNLKDIIDEKEAVIEAQQLPVVKIIPIQFIQLFTNIIANALKYSKHDIPPYVKINTDIALGSSINSHEAKTNMQYWSISIQDNGIGFDQKYEQKIFEIFQRLHGRDEYSGTGIGLAICKKIVQNHQGIITAVGEPGIGSTFTIYIPVEN